MDNGSHIPPPNWWQQPPTPFLHRKTPPLTDADIALAVNEAVRLIREHQRHE